MSGLVLKLGPHERVLINGAVIENGDKRSRLAIMTPQANILRLRDAIHPEEVNTPVRRVCCFPSRWPARRMSTPPSSTASIRIA